MVSASIKIYSFFKIQNNCAVFHLLQKQIRTLVQKSVLLNSCFGELAVKGHTSLSATHRDFDDYGQNQISAVQFSPTGQYLAIVTDDR